MVGAPRFELGTPCTPCKCATRLRHAPIVSFFLTMAARAGKYRAPRPTPRSGNDTPSERLEYVRRSPASIRRRGARARSAPSAPQQLEHFFQLRPHLPHDLLRLAHVRARLFAGELVARAGDREALVVQQAADLPDDDHVLPLVVAPVAAPLDRLQLRELLLPVAQHV